MSERGQQRPQVNTSVLAAGAITAVFGALLLSLGGSLIAGALAAAARRWVRQLETAPSELARSKFRQLQRATAAGTSAGATAWRGESDGR